MNPFLASFFGCVFALAIWTVLARMWVVGKMRSIASAMNTLPPDVQRAGEVQGEMVARELHRQGEMVARELHRQMNGGPLIERAPLVPTYPPVPTYTSIAPHDITPHYLAIDKAQDWMILDVRVAGKTIYSQPGPIPGDLFGGVAIDGFITWPSVIKAGEEVAIDAVYVGLEGDARFRYELVPVTPTSKHPNG